MSARQPGWRRASARNHWSIGSSSASSPSIWRRATARAWRLAGGSVTRSSQARLARDSSSWVGRGSPWWNKAAWMRCCQAVRWSTRVLRSRTVVRRSRIQAGGIQELGSRSCSSNSRSSRASVRSVLARRLGPRRLLVSAGSARWATNPAAWSSSTTNRQPVQPSTANPPPAPGSSPSQAPTPALVAGVMRPRRASPLSRSTQSKVIWARCTSSPPRMLIGTSFEFRPCGRQHDHPCLSRRGSLHMSSSDQPSFRRPRSWPGALTFRAVTAMAARYAILPSPGHQRRTNRLNSGACTWRYGCVSQDGGAAIPRPSPNPRPSDSDGVGCSASAWMAPDGSSLLTLGAPSVQTAPDGSRRIQTDRLDDQADDQASQAVWSDGAARVVAVGCRSLADDKADEPGGGDQQRLGGAPSEFDEGEQREGGDQDGGQVNDGATAEHYHRPGDGT